MYHTQLVLSEHDSSRKVARNSGRNILTTAVGLVLKSHIGTAHLGQAYILIAANIVKLNHYGWNALPVSIAKVSVSILRNTV